MKTDNDKFKKLALAHIKERLRRKQNQESILEMLDPDGNIMPWPQPHDRQPTFPNSSLESSHQNSLLATADWNPNSNSSTRNYVPNTITFSPFQSPDFSHILLQHQPQPDSHVSDCDLNPDPQSNQQMLKGRGGFIEANTAPPIKPQNAAQHGQANFQSFDGFQMNQDNQLFLPCDDLNLIFQEYLPFLPTMPAAEETGISSDGYGEFEEDGLQNVFKSADLNININQEFAGRSFEPSLH
jgi:hypothetical protein